MEIDVKSLAKKARQSSLVLRAASNELRNQGLTAMAKALKENEDSVYAANARDMAKAEADGLSPALLKRLKFDESKLATLLEGLRELSEMPDPLGKTLYAMEMDKGMELFRVSCPIGVMGIIFEARPDALVQISSLCLKSGNCVLLKGGSEAAETNKILFELIRKATTAIGLPEGWIGLMESRENIRTLLEQEEDVDLIIPRGSNAFVRYIMENTRIPVLGHAEGLCHIYAHEDCGIDQAVRVITDSKTQYVSVCNAVETLLVHEKVAPILLPKLKEALEAKQVEIRGCEKTRKIISCLPATAEDWDTEYLDLILSVKVVEDEQEAIDHINAHGSHHTDAILTNDEDAKRMFVSLVDSADVFINCSTRFADGYCYGLGAEIGIATGRIHARGPVGLEGLLIYKYVLEGSGQCKADYANGGFTHRPLEKESRFS